MEQVRPQYPFSDIRPTVYAVSYASLNHCARWRNEIPKLKIEELEGAEHREILANRLFFKCVLAWS